MLDEMFRLQLEEDKKVHEAKDINYQYLLDENLYFWALLDEVGEYVHEGKPGWCWWKKEPEQFNQEKELEELSDITHFVLSFCLAMVDGNLEEVMRYCPDEPFYEFTTETSLLYLLGGANFPYCAFGQDLPSRYEKRRYIECMLKHWLNVCYPFDFETEVYLPYIKKNAINQKRVEEGY